MIQEFFKKFGKIKKIKKGDFLYKASENDKNLYFITQGSILLSYKGNQIAIIGDNEISGEKSFLENKNKPIDAIAIKDTEILYIDPETFKKLDISIQNKFLKKLTLFISQRVYLLNDIITNISFINKQLANKPALNNEYLSNIFKNLFQIKTSSIYKIYFQRLLPIFESDFNPDITQKIEELIKNNENIILKESYIIIKTTNYIFYFKINNKIKNEYIIINTCMHILKTLDYLGEKLENLKNQELSNYLE